MIGFAQRMDGLSGSAIRQIFSLLARPGMISFAGGNPNPATFPAADVARITGELMADLGGVILQYGDTPGYAPLRESVAAFVNSKGISADVKNTLILSGSSQGLELAAKVFLDEGDVILTEAPTFLGALQTFRSYRAVPVGVASDERGMVMEDLEDKLKTTKAKVIYTIPTFQNPTGITLSLDRRKKLLELAEKYDAIVLEDDPYADLRYTGEAVKNIKTMDETGRVVFLGSFSKIISPGLRVGYAIATPEILAKMTIGKQGADVHTSNLTQAVVDRYMREGRLLPHIKDCCASYTVQLDAMLSAIEKYFPKEVTVTHPEGGIFLWATLPEHARAVQVFEKAVENNVAFVPGEHFYPDLSGKNTMRLNYSMANPDTIDKGIKILSQIIADSIK